MAAFPPPSGNGTPPSHYFFLRGVDLSLEFSPPGFRVNATSNEDRVIGSDTELLGHLTHRPTTDRADRRPWSDHRSLLDDYEDPHGKAMRAMAQDPEVAALLGININRIAELTFIIGGALAAAAGALIGPIFLIYPAMGLTACLKAFVVVILGGLGNVPGAAIAGFALGVIESLGAGFISSAYKDVFAFLVLILVLWARPEGILGKTAKKIG